MYMYGVTDIVAEHYVLQSNGFGTSICIESVFGSCFVSDQLNSQRRKRLQSQRSCELLNNPRRCSPTPDVEDHYTSSPTKVSRTVVHNNYSTSVPTLPSSRNIRHVHNYSLGASRSIFPVRPDSMELYQRPVPHSSSTPQFSLHHLFGKQATVNFSLNHL